MKNRSTSIVILCLLVTAGFIGYINFESDVVSAGSTWYVGSGPGNDSGAINGGIALANDGDTVFVYSGVYFEQISIDKPINLIGEDPNTTIIDGMDGKVVQVLYTEWVNVTGFTITNGENGIYITSSSFINIQGNEIYNNLEGIITLGSSNNTYANNIVHDNPRDSTHWGVGFFFSGTPYSNNKIIGNVVYNNGADGIHLEDQTSIDEDTFWNNSIINNTVYNNAKDGISIDMGRNNFIVDNTVHHNGLGAVNPHSGIRISASKNNVVMGNTVHNNVNGIELSGSIPNNPLTQNTFTRNTIYSNDIGIRVRDSQDNTFIENTIFNNNYSVYLVSVLDPDVCYGNDFIDSTLANATIANVYIDNSLSNNFINCTLANAIINVYMREQSWDNNFINCSLSNATRDDFNLSEDSHAVLLNTTFNKTRVYYGDTLSSLTVKWYMHVHVIYYNGSPVSGAEIWINETFGANLLHTNADSLGWIRWFVVTEYIEWDMDGDHIGDRIFFPPLNVTATDGNLWGYAEPIMDKSKVVLIILGAPTELLPPTNLTTKTVNNGNNVELEWDPPSSPALDHYLIYRADSATEFDFTTPYNISTTWLNPLNTTWVDPDSGVTAVDDDFYYIVRAANFDESVVSVTSNTAGVWTRTFQSGISTFSLPLEPFVKNDTEFYCQDMNATYIKWMNTTTHTWMRHDKGDSENNSLIEMGEGYEIGFLGKSIQTKYTFTGMPGAMIIYDDDILFSGFDSDARNLTVSIEPDGNVTLTWQEPASMGVGDWYEVYYSNTRDGFFGTLGIHYDLACPAVNYGTNTTTITGLGANDLGARLYFMVVPFNSLGVRGASTYSTGVWTEEYLDQYDTFGIPLKLSNCQTSDWYCDNIPDTVGINYYDVSAQRWSWHSTRMPEGAFDPLLVMTEGYQISTSDATKYTFIGW